ncbi:MAG: hypothetical protein ACREMB_01960 [Candidatus Rokuibacteriota bacterium]
MRRAFCWLLTLIIVLSLAAPAAARIAAIETTAPLDDHSQESIESAIRQALQSAVRGAVAMGLPWVQVDQAVVFADAVIVKILASDSRFEDDDTPDEDVSPEAVKPAAIPI